MPHPIAFKVSGAPALRALSISLDPSAAGGLTPKMPAGSPAIIAVSDVVVLDQLSAGILNHEDVRLLVEGDWSKAILIVLPDGSSKSKILDGEGDQGFLNSVDSKAPGLSGLARELVAAIRGRGIEGGLKLEGSRWVNRPLNSFTLAVQPRVQNFQFTIYGGPERFGSSDFLKTDQNGYSRGWIRSPLDVERFVALVAIAHERKLRR